MVHVLNNQVTIAVNVTAVKVVVNVTEVNVAINVIVVNVAVKFWINAMVVLMCLMSSCYILKQVVEVGLKGRQVKVEVKIHGAVVHPHSLF